MFNIDLHEPEKNDALEFTELSYGEYFVLAEDALDDEYFLSASSIYRKIRKCVNPLTGEHDINAIDIRAEKFEQSFDFILPETEVFRIEIKKVVISIDW